MHRRGGISVLTRALVVAAVLYGVFLQSFLAAATPLAMSGSGILCSEGSEPSGRDHGPAGHDRQCCVANHPASVLPPVQQSVGLAIRLPRLVRAMRPEASVPRTGPPTHAQSARGPPFA